MIENDVHELITALGRDADKTFAEASGDALRRILSEYSQEESSVVGGLIKDFGLEVAMEILETIQNFVEVALSET